MDNKSILDIGSLLADINQGTALKIGRFFQDAQEDQRGTSSVKTDEYEDRGQIGDYENTYQEICHLLNNIKQKWNADTPEQNIFNPYYQRDLLYLYDRITLDMNYLNDNPERNNEWLEKLQELKYEIRNML